MERSYLEEISKSSSLNYFRGVFQGNMNIFYISVTLIKLIIFSFALYICNLRGTS